MYRPPRLQATAMDEGEDPDRRGSAKERRKERAASRRGGRSALVTIGHFCFDRDMCCFAAPWKARA